jgi:aryl-alcohol dehydrogenase-like predicted oxidoreductase
MAECEYTVASGLPAVMQMVYDILEQVPVAIFAQAHAAGIGVIARVPLKRGMLSGRFNEETTFVDTDLRGRILSSDKMPTMVTKVQQIEVAAASVGRPLAEIAMRFCISNPHVAVTIPGIRTPEQARSNAAACEPLPADVFEALRQLA